jgi:hypothetical protein
MLLNPPSHCPAYLAGWAIALCFPLPSSDLSVPRLFTTSDAAPPRAQPQLRRCLVRTSAPSTSVRCTAAPPRPTSTPPDFCRHLLEEHGEDAHEGEWQSVQRRWGLQGAAGRAIKLQDARRATSRTVELQAACFRGGNEDIREVSQMKWCRAVPFVCSVWGTGRRVEKKAGSACCHLDFFLNECIWIEERD